MPLFRNIVLSSVLLRVALILYSEWHDARSLVKYTDVDYRVFSDAAAFLLRSGPGATNQARGDPYTRETFRYTPLLALLLTPNVWLHPSFGKYLFAACDIINGLLIYQLLVKEKLAAIYAASYLLNPLVFSISTRGSSESILSLFILLTLYAALNSRWDVAAIMLGISTHWKIYPIIYGIGNLGVIGAAERDKGYFRTIVNWRTTRFTLISAGTFLILGAGCYAIWGYPFLHESYLYHVHRLDHRHNFSPYFYLTYLTYPSHGASNARAPELWSRILRSPLTSFVPQMILTLGSGLLFGRSEKDLVFTWFVQTTAFVIFNKVCTSQYFLWYLLLVPLLAPQLLLSRWKVVACVGVWVGTQALWLAEAYKLEMLGDNVFFTLWVRGLFYVVGNCWVLIQVINGYDR
ncbi:glycosyltransferase family 50 protein [Laccaria bicolor S238N-H82]|uniref:GPI mannosyltransferase 1 n=1 Tax=Laccaria bicolor (strain S238N-H82 / ATCC MYA-4686) TaxID=486041 RepID=B0DPZ8_LACBS|nr:glycosyltransferase family 50 protein [Laccaria bicolor S238N-H82]EDR03204.1 glycosyltransferase family 50 protein [Laccaria bicolor S238N-H82]|eukprot:XP_001886000.1 glycosyltransferase family 50 protein [Laccaria bicolor S238N-H82]